MKILRDSEIYSTVVVDGILQARDFVWIATANLKDLHVRQGMRFVSITDVFARMARDGISVRIIHAAEPSSFFQRSFDKHEELIQGEVEFLQCPRLHFKMVVIDGKRVYVGSANLTGAGLGAKSDKRRNFEIGLWFEGSKEVKSFMKDFDNLWMGKHCPACGRRKICPDPIE